MSDLRRLPAGWVAVQLDDVVDVLDFEREPINSSERNERIALRAGSELFPYFGATGKVGWIDGYRSEGQRILLGEDGAPFLDASKDKAYVANGRFWVNNHAHVLQGAEGLVDNRYLCHQLNTVDYQPYVSGSTRLKLTSASMRRIPLVVAPAAEQTRIVAKLEELLSGLDAGVAELKAAQKKLAKYRQSLLKAAVEGALTADWRAQRAHQQGEVFETGAQLLERILRERRARWEAKQVAKFEEQGKTPPKDWQDRYAEPVPPDTAGLPELPQGWVWASLDQLLFDLRSGSAETSGRVKTDYPVLKSSAVRQAAIDFTALNYFQRQQCRSENYLEVGDLLITRLSGSVEYVGCAAVVNAVPAVGVQYPDRIFCGKTLLATRWLGDLLVCWFRSGYARSRIEAAAKSTAGHKRISLSDLHPFPLPLPPMSEAKEVVLRAAESLKQVEDGEAAVARAVRHATAQRKNILKAAFSGQLVPQDPADEPANRLLECIRTERAAKVSRAASKQPRSRKATAEAA